MDTGVGRPRRRRRWRWLARGAAAALILLAADYVLYPRLAGISAPTANRGENGLWLRYTWYFGRRADSDTRALARDLRERQIRYAYFHVRYIRKDGTLRFRHPRAARRLVETLHREAPSVKVLAWVYVGNHLGIGDVGLSEPVVRRVMVREALWLVNTCGFDGVQWDYEISETGDPHFLSLVRETRAALPPGKLLSAAVPIWLPTPVWHIGWTEDYFAQVARHCDQLAVMCYDTGLYLPRAYVALMRRQAIHVTRAVARGNPRCRVLLGVPTYGPGSPAHHAPAENLRMAL